MVESVGQKSTNGAPASSPADSSLKRAITRYPLLAVFCATNAKNCSGTRSQSDYGIWHFALVNILMCHLWPGKAKKGEQNCRDKSAFRSGECRNRVLIRWCSLKEAPIDQPHQS